MIKKRLNTLSDDDSKCGESFGGSRSKCRKKRSLNVLQKVLNRAQSGFFNSSINEKSNDKLFAQIPPELKFCLKDIVPFCFLAEHVFMGLSLCGTFLISYHRSCESESFDFNSGYKYELFFWIFKPHEPLKRFYKVNLFDDHGTEDIKCVTITQWTNDPSTLIVHGSSEIDDQHSFLSIIKVPKVGCVICKKLRDNDTADNVFKNLDLCLQCNFTIHTKYRFNESTQNFDPKIHLAAPEFLIICENSLIHTLSVKLDMQKIRNVGRNYIGQKYLIKPGTSAMPSSSQVMSEVGQENLMRSENKPAISIVEQILADFSELTENDCLSPSPAKTIANEGCETRNRNNTLTSNGTLNQPKTIFEKTEEGNQGESSLLRKSPSSPQEMLEAAAKTYEFSEENEKYEKISLFRKRRLADKKYEFSEENTENIIPYSRTRTKFSKRNLTQFHPRTSPHTSTFRSPCGSPVPNRSSFMSPPGFRSPSYYTYRSSPTRHFLYSPPPRHHQSPAYGSEDIHKYFSDIMNRRIKDGRFENFVENFQEDIIKSPKDALMFSKKIINYYIEEDDANSVVTMHDEDDCISPGYHLSMPMEVHGTCYSKMQIVSKSSLNRLKGIPRAIITQNSFDIEHFSIHIANLLCKKNDKKYGILFDLAFEIVHVCPLSQMILCAVCLQFTASDFDRLSQCLNCSNDSDCFTHRKLFESTVLFSWNLTGDEWKVLDTDQLKQISSQVKLSHPIRGNRQEILIRKLQRFIKRIFGKDRSALDRFDHLKILDSNEDKSKESLTDFHNGIEFYRRQPFDSPSTISSLSSNSSPSNSSDSDSCDESLH